MSKRLSRFLRMSTAVMVLAAFVAWRPAMAMGMGAMPLQMHHAAHHHASPAPASGPRVVASARCVHVLLRALHRARPAMDRVERIVLTVPHRLPFSIGPPLHRA